MSSQRVALLALLIAGASQALACSSDETPGPSAGSGGTGGRGGTAGGGAGGTAGAAAGTGGAGGAAAGKGGGSGAGGSAGNGGSAGGGAGGTAGTAAGTSGSAGTSGGAGAAGAAGSSGAAGAAGSGGMSGAAGTAGAGGASGAAGAAGQGGSGGGGTFTLTLEGFTPMAGCADDMRDNCTVWPRDLQQYMNGPNMSPAMSWANPPAGTMSFAVSLQDLSNDNAHWILWNLPASTTMLPESVPISMMNQSSIASNGYFGPGSSCNVYEFMVYALSMATFTPDEPMDSESVLIELKALGNQILGTASVRGRQDFSGNCNP
jgi:phosphatidylethanolamine-binding protein (PEBP) family uncharacterized protein